MDVVDTHPHVNAEDLVKYPLNPIGGKLSIYAEKHRMSAEQFIKYMDDAGVAQSTLIQSGTGYGYDNSYCADSADRYPDRFVGVCCVDAPASDAQEKLRYWITERKMAGSRLFTAPSTTGETYWLDQPITYPYFEEAERLGIPVCIAIRNTGVPMAVNVIERYPNIRFILDHMALPMVEDGAPYAQAKPLFDLAKYPNVTLKFTNNNIISAGKGASTVKAFFSLLLDKFGASRMMWGSNMPSIWKNGPEGSYTDLVDMARRELSFVSEADRVWMFAETARSLYPSLRGR
jgi:L-fuconolactonase